MHDMSLSFETFEKLDRICMNLVNEHDIIFVGVVTNLGNLIASHSRLKKYSNVTDDNLKTLFIQLSLDLKMRKEHNDNVGEINSIVEYRENLKTATIPMYENTFIVITDLDVDISDIASKIKSKLF